MTHALSPRALPLYVSIRPRVEHLVRQAAYSPQGPHRISCDISEPERREEKKHVTKHSRHQSPMAPRKAIELDGRTGEGGGQLVRIACALAAVTSQPIRITHVRGNRGGPRGGGGRSFPILPWLAVHSLNFAPSLPPPQQASSRSTSRRCSGSPPPPAPPSPGSPSAATRSSSAPRWRPPRPPRPWHSSSSSRRHRLGGRSRR